MASPATSKDDTPYVTMEMGEEDGNKGDIIAKQAVEHNVNDPAADDVSIVSSVLTQEGIHDFTGFCCVCLVILIGDMSRGVMFPSMWPLVERLGGTTVTLGYSVAAFSWGRVLVNPIFGSWSHSLGYTKTLLVSCTLLLMGTLLYAQVDVIGEPAVLILAQTLLGIGSGTLGVTRAFVADVTAQRQRTTYMALSTAMQYGGFTVTPLFGALFNWALKDKEYQFACFRLNMYTAPAWFMAAVVSMVIAVLLIFFKDRQRDSTTRKKQVSDRRQTMNDFANSTTRIGLTVLDCCILGCMLLNVSTKGSIATFETLGVRLAESHFALDASRAGLTVSLCGMSGVFFLLNMGHLSQWFNDIQLITGGMAIMVLGALSLVGLDSDAANPAWRYNLAMALLYGIGYPVGHTAVIGLFSKGAYVVGIVAAGNFAISD